MASNSYAATRCFLTQPLTGGLARTAGLSLGATGCVPGLQAQVGSPSSLAGRAPELQHDGCARRRGEPRVEQLPGNRLLSRPTLRPLSPSQGPFFFPPPPPFSLEPDPVVQVRNCSQCHQQPPALGILGTHGPRRGRERRVLGGEWEAQPGCEKFCWDTSLPDFITPSSPHTPKPRQLP